MGGYGDKVQKAVGDVLGADEAVLAAIRTQPRGTVTGTAVGGLIGAAVASKQASKARAAVGEGTDASAWPVTKLAVAVTRRRLLGFNFSAMGKPKELQAEIPLERVADVTLTGQKLTKNVQVAFADGSAIELECGKLEKVDDFISAFRGAKAGAG